VSELHAVATNPDDAWVRKLADLIDGDQWTLADTLLDHYSLDEFPENDGDGRNGLHVALRQDENALARRFGIIATVGHLRNVRATAVAWPRASRNARASFSVHKMMRGKDRQQEMVKRLRQADHEGMALSQRMLSRLRAEEKPASEMRAYDERLRQAITNAVRREMLAGYGGVKRKDWWMLEEIVPSMSAADAEVNRAVAVRELRALASAIAKGAETS
jgi:hypothetical protein